MQDMCHQQLNLGVIVKNFVVYTFPFDGFWDIVVLMEDLNFNLKSITV